LRPKLKQPWDKIGNTRLVKISDRLYAKMETENPTGSIKDRPIQYIVKKALEEGKIFSDTVLVEASSGNTGISVSAIGASLGLPVKIIMPSNMSEERRQMMKLFGATIIDAPPSDFKAAISMRNDLVEKDKRFWSPMQFENPLNIQCHKETTGREILSQVPPFSEVIAFFSGAGTGGTIMGVRESFREKEKDPRFMLVVPEEEDGHGIQGIGDGADYLVKRENLSGVVPISTEDAKSRAKKFARESGVLVGISSGANLCASERFIEKENPDGIVVTTLCDRGERYLSIY